ncbi:hypothetical protein BKA62DRAFT_724635 [Auriculariales sp. MPI-PUGE-AT-0066]|nr:hypothetical protein BKA62DRAFT_724635 [Auriculariales sp. MPI-PUGE-AT-0066]
MSRTERTLLDGVRAHPRVALAITATATAALTLGAVGAYSRLNRKHRRRELERDVKDSIELLDSRVSTGSGLGSVSMSSSSIINGPYDSAASLALSSAPEASPFDESLVREHLARNYAFFGDEGMQKVRGSTVVVVGCGGVGSWAAVMLARSGVGTLRLIDFDYVSLSSLNRHASALAEDVGIPKVQSLARTLRAITRAVDVQPHVALWKADEDGFKLLDGADWVVDAIDNIGTKVDMLRECSKRGIKVFASMGAGAKSDPTRVQIADIAQTTYDPLARAVRRRLKMGVPSVTDGIPVVYSTEVPDPALGLLPLAEDEHAKGAVHELAPLDEFRVRILPVFGPLPAIFGLHIATYIISDLAGRPVVNPLPVRHRKKLYDKGLKDLVVRETRMRGETEGVRIPISEDDCAFLMEDLHRGRSCVPPFNVPARPVFVRWDPCQQLSLKNVVLMEKEDADRHEKTVLAKWKGKLVVEGGIVQSKGATSVGTLLRHSSSTDSTDSFVDARSTPATPASSVLGRTAPLTREPEPVAESAESRAALELAWGPETVALMDRRGKEVDEMLRWAL